MKKLLPALAIVAVLFSCNNATDKGKFTVNGELRSATDQKIYLEELFFSQKSPEVLDTGIIKNGKFTVSAIAAEEGLYRLRTEDGKDTFFLINDGANISFSGNVNNRDLSGQVFSGPANSSLQKIRLHLDTVRKLIESRDRAISALLNAGTTKTDSTYLALSNEMNMYFENFASYCIAYTDTAKSPVVCQFAADIAPVEPTKFEAILNNLSKRFPNHQAIAGTISYIKAQMAQQDQSQTKPQSSPSIGSMAPEITMNDVNDKPFSLSQLRGKYVLVDFWASWCGPCRGENPNVVAAYNQFKDKNFTILGVSLDDNKSAWIKAIAADNLSWQQVSDLKKWSSAAVGLYGLEGIPYNVLVDPQGKIIATNLRESALQNKLAEVLK